MNIVVMEMNIREEMCELVFLKTHQSLIHHIKSMTYCDVKSYTTFLVNLRSNTQNYKITSEI